MNLVVFSRTAFLLAHHTRRFFFITAALLVIKTKPKLVTGLCRYSCRINFHMMSGKNIVDNIMSHLQLELLLFEASVFPSRLSGLDFNLQRWGKSQMFR